jgi:outer membrane autotransporter protein
MQAGGISFEPFTGLAYVNLDTDGFGEKGGAAALRSHGNSADAAFSTFGVRTETGFDLAGLNATAHGTLGWRHAYGDVTPDANLAFAGSSTFGIEGVPIARNTALVSLGVDLDISDNGKFGLSYSGQFGSGIQDQSAKAKLSFSF